MAGTGGRIRQARLAAGLTQTLLARAASTSERNIVRWEGGENMPRAEHLAAIAKATGTSVESLLGDGEDDAEAASSMAVAPLTSEEYALYGELTARIVAHQKERQP